MIHDKLNPSNSVNMQSMEVNTISLATILALVWRLWAATIKCPSSVHTHCR